MKQQLKQRFYLFVLSFCYIIDGILGIVTLGFFPTKWMLHFKLVIFRLKSDWFNQ